MYQNCNMSIVRSSDHDCYDHYELKDYNKLFKCDGCKMKGFGPRYHCAPCGRELHKECRHPKSTIHHDYFGGSIFTFRREPYTKLVSHNRRQFSKCCDACGKDVCGFSYRCEENDKDLHPCCANLEEKLLIDNTIFDLQSDVSSKCIRCKKKKITDGARDVRGWSYVSACGKYHFHVYCMAELVHDACMRYGEVGPGTGELARSSRGRGSRAEKMLQMIKSVVKIILAALLGDPTMLISNVIVDLVSRGV
ncbi:hypothetical protein SASPL_140768 [Salvia splendens]|uniref:Phorbol-ester/DAG-type domain-containing protein n=1 Tax=Salvia splendens TaxID=180675 RepID=A0A8X8WQK7_SALSN|nr:uncharacterized protein LOC121769144 isoform X1 [Salvia splendens]KAG6399292.1 hypothetical protein SASPL_140768 [Salvia splendens]